jgi:hypothetical protein
MARRSATAAHPDVQPVLVAAIAPALDRDTAQDTERERSVRVSVGAAAVVSQLPPPTNAQVYYWRELAGAVSACGTAGLRDDEWPADLAPSKPTLHALVARGVLARRGCAWHLRRGWFATLAVLRDVAVDAPVLHVADRPAPGLPTYAELHACEAVCRWLDTQPWSRARLPFAGLDLEGAAPGLPIAALRLMRRYRLVRHTASCEWILARRWKPRLLGLWDGVDAATRRSTPTDAVSAPPPPPTSLVAGIDTWHLNWCVSERAIRDGTALPARLRTQLDALQERAREEEAEVDTPWVYDGAPLRMYRWGTKAERGRSSAGVSWSYVLVTPSLRLLIRRVPLGGIVAQARLGAECLWRLTPRRALDELDVLARRLWTAPTRGRAPAELHWQVSQVHLAHDVMHAPLEAEQLARYVSRSRTRVVYEAARGDVAALLADVGGGAGGGTQDSTDLVTVDWGVLYADDGALALGWDNGILADDDEEPLEDRASTTYTWGQRLSGVTFSPGGATSVVLYDKTLEQRLRSKATMEPLWRIAGWDGVSTVTRHEVRLRRDALRVLRLAEAEGRPCLDDPWQFLAHQGDVFGAILGRADAGACPDAIAVAWLRRVVPAVEERNRSRWATDPVWRVVQAASFTDAPLAARRMVRRHQRSRDVRQLDVQVYGLLVSRVAQLHPEGGQWDVSQAIGEAAKALIVESTKPDKDFGTLVRERRKLRGLPVPAGEKVLPFRAGAARDAQTPLLAEVLDEAVAQPDDAERTARLRVKVAEVRLSEAGRRLDESEAERHRVPTRQMHTLEEAFLQETRTYAAACTLLEGFKGQRRRQ